MSTLIKHQQFYAKNAHTSSSITHYTLEKPLDYSQGLENHPIYPSQSFHVENVDTSTLNSSRQQVNLWINYSGLQDIIYNMEDDK